ncbi:MAG: serine/threonine protein kinase [Betaproteobacteria bacterium]|nr:MAG: serine/threonine protein kinase [Betaproteobacteria bacterium]
MKETVVDRWKTLSPQLDHLLDLSVAERERFLDELSLTNAPLATDLRALLGVQSEAQDTDFLEITSKNQLRRDSGATLVGTQLGAYTITKLIGHGGMGTVWLADRSDGQFEGRAAVKLLNLSLVGQASAARFRREGSILAKLSHPAIARLIDAGLSGTGQPYLILEYVDGECIDQYCRAKQLDGPSIVKLFSQLLPAVAQAHSQLVVHRDIKPGNVMVTEDGGVAQIKLLDFGIAGFVQHDTKGDEPNANGAVAANTRPTETAQAPTAHDLTKLAGHALTVNYASPEQIRRERVTTASDVYSLGALLYSLLAGRSAYRVERQTTAALEESILRGDLLPINHANNKTSFRVTRDLEAIIFKAMALRPEDRYDSVTSFHDDIERYRLQQPVRARGRARAYLARAFLRRHWLVIGCVAASFAAVSGAAFKIWNESETLKRTKAFLIETLTPTSYYNDGGGLLSQRDLLLRAANQLDTRFKDQPKAAAELYETIGESLFNMGEHQLSYEVRSKAQPLIDSVHGADSREAIRNASRVTYMHLTMNRYQEFNEALTALRARCGVTAADTPNPKCLAPEWMNSMYSVSIGRSREAVARWTEMDARLSPSIDDASIWHVLVGYWGATASTSAGDMVRAKQLWQRVLSIPSVKKDPKGNHQFALAIARALNEAGLQQEAATLARGAFNQGVAYMGEAFDQRLFYLPGVVAIEITAGQTRDSEQQLLKALVKAQTTNDTGREPIVAPTQESATSRAALGLLYAITERYEPARDRLNEALNLYVARSNGYNEAAMRMRIHLAAVQALAGARSDAETTLNALRTETTQADDSASGARIDALLSWVSVDSAKRELAWRSATEWMRTSDSRLPDIRALLTAAGSVRPWPAPVDDGTIGLMRTYSAGVLESTQRAMESRPRSLQPTTK